ncbi:hypothetical protein B4113_3534 [Geobacillus sp. B4113_201601]|nr:hypothetical protein B4113_3534 [Geobacillus sp. B4113_201601]
MCGKCLKLYYYKYAKKVIKINIFVFIPFCFIDIIGNKNMMREEWVER